MEKKSSTINTQSKVSAKLEMRKSFILYSDSLDVLDHLTDEQAGVLFKAIKSYNNSDEITLDSLLNIAFIPIRNHLDRDNEKYENICERNRANGLKGGRPPKPKEPTGLTGNPKKPKKAYNDSDSDSGNDNKEKKASKARPTSASEVSEYAKSINFNLDGQSFIDHYEANGWMRGKSSIKSWKACVRTWKARDTKEKPIESAPAYDPITEDLTNLKEMQEEGTALFANGKPITLDGNQFFRTDVDNGSRVNAYSWLSKGNTINSGVTI